LAFFATWRFDYPASSAASWSTVALKQPYLNITRILALLAVLAITVVVFLLRDHADELAVYGYPGIFLISFLSYATVLLPAPGVAVVFAMGAVFNPIAVAIAAGTGAALGETTGYLVGFSGQGIAERADIYDRLTGWMHKYGAWTILVLSAIPNPFFDIAGLVAGTLKMPYLKFLVSCWIGQVIKMLFFAFLGNSSINIFF
jgi:membrane protein YqaA with SNARE-associated domain